MTNIERKLSPEVTKVVSIQEVVTTSPTSVQSVHQSLSRVKVTKNSKHRDLDFASVSKVIFQSTPEYCSVELDFWDPCEFLGEGVPYVAPQPEIRTPRPPSQFSQCKFFHNGLRHYHRDPQTGYSHKFRKLSWPKRWDCRKYFGPFSK